MIVVPALHPARDITALVERLEAGDVHRATTTLDAVGGKSINVARFVRQMGSPVRLIALADEALAAMLRQDPDLGGDALPQIELVLSPVPSRTDLAIVDRSGSATVLNSVAGDPGAAAVADVVARTIEPLMAADVLVLAGSLPGGTSGVLATLIRAAHDRGARVIVDASGEWLVEALEARPDVVKINDDEASALDRSRIDARGAAAGGAAPPPRPPSDSERPVGLRTPEIVAVTEGARGLRAWTGRDGWRVVTSPGQPVVNPVGAGDAVTAGLALGLHAGRAPIDALVLGSAMAAARLRHLECRVDRDDVEALVASVSVTPLGVPAGS